MRKAFLLLFALTTAPLALAQPTPDHVRVQSFTSYTAAQAALPLTADPRQLVPVRLIYADFYGNQIEMVTYLVISQGTPIDPPEQLVAVNPTYAPIEWFGTSSCGHGLRYTQTQDFADWTSASAFVAGLNPQQTDTLSMRELSGTQYPGIRVAVEWQQSVVFCVSH